MQGEIFGYLTVRCSISGIKCIGIDGNLEHSRLKLKFAAQLRFVTPLQPLCYPSFEDKQEAVTEFSSVWRRTARTASTGDMPPCGNTRSSRRRVTRSQAQGTSWTTPRLPTQDDAIDVCFISDDGTDAWWRAVVERCHIIRHTIAPSPGQIAAFGTLLYDAANGEGEQRNEVHFMTSGELRTVRGAGVNGEFSKWRVVTEEDGAESTEPSQTHDVAPRARGTTKQRSSPSKQQCLLPRKRGAPTAEADSEPAAVTRRQRRDTARTFTSSERVGAEEVGEVRPSRSGGLVSAI